MINTSFLSWLSCLLAILINVALVTLFERKILGYAQLRKGPNKTGVAGILQPLADAIKLFSKEALAPLKTNKSHFLASATAGIALMSAVLFTIYMNTIHFSAMFHLILILALLGLGVYPLFIAGWASNSKYAMVGALRGIAQTISYEISLSLLILSLAFSVSTFSLADLSGHLASCPMYALTAPLVALWLVSCIAETNRTPFDFAEGESELVSGFNVEYGGFMFALIYMAEYGMILYFSILTTSLFFFPVGGGPLFPAVFILFVAVWMWLRATFPRFRYDKLMNLAWKAFLPLALMWTPFFLAISIL